MQVTLCPDDGIGIGIRKQVKVFLQLAAAASTLFDWCAGVDFDVRLVVGWAGGRAHSVLDLSSHRHKCLLHVGSVLCTRFKEWDA